MPKSDIRVTGLTDENFQKLKEIANKERRSLQKQSLFFLEEAIREHEKAEK